MASTLVGNSGRTYIQGEMLRLHHQHKDLTIHKAQSGDQHFTLKRVWPSAYDVNLRLAAEFAESRNLRIHVDCKEDENGKVLVYPYFRDTLLALIEGDPGLHMLYRMKILRQVGEAIKELHQKNWLHIDIKPDNIFVNWTCDSEGNKTITDIALGDFDIAVRPEGVRPLCAPQAIGNVMWRSPEGQTGIGLTKASDIFSFALVCIYTLGGGQRLLISDYEDLRDLGIALEQEMLSRHFVYFGLPNDNLYNLVKDEDWCNIIRRSSHVAKTMIADEPELKFEMWARCLGPEALEMIGGMANIDPTARTGIEEVLAHSWWSDLQYLEA
ncbi:hypothetical protein NX059_002518 [Plenodomus lindquistii]|nr:hypothetical protein NX059_002518 [Plenodomus lindquistii]